MERAKVFWNGRSQAVRLPQSCRFDTDEVVVNSIRRGEVPGIHSIRYDSEADSITITHDAHSRKGFALGAVLAAEYTAEHTGLLTTTDLFKF